MHNIKVLNNIDQNGLDRFPRESFLLNSEKQEIDAIILRSHDLHNFKIPASVKAIGRAGAGVNNIPIDKMSSRGIPVFNAPGANANAVKELTIAALLISARNICAARDYVNSIDLDDVNLKSSIEKGKKAAFFVSKGNALDMMTNQVTMIYFDGKSQSTTNFQEELYLKYKTKYSEK